MSTNLPNLATITEQPALESARMSGEDRRRQLIRVAMSLFSQKGFTGTTTKEIAVAANVNEAIIFRHFATKDDLYAAILDYKANEICSNDWLDELREHAARQDDEAVFRTIAEKRLTHHRCDADDQFLRLMFYSALEGHTLAETFLERQARPIHEFLCDYVKRRQRDGAFRGVHPSVAVESFFGALNDHMMRNAFFKSWRLNIPDEEVIENLVSLLLGGLRAERAEPQPTAKARVTTGEREAESVSESRVKNRSRKTKS